MRKILDTAMILPFPSGGPGEFVIRLVADGLSCAFKQSVTIENHERYYRSDRGRGRRT
jgi:hypothetical protein